MENVILTIHLLIVLALIGVVLLQRSEGGGLGMGGGGGAMSGRAAATALSKVTWVLGIGLFATSITLTIIAAQNAAGSSVLDRISDAPVPVVAPEEDLLGDNPLLETGDDATPQTPAAD